MARKEDYKNMSEVLGGFIKRNDLQKGIDKVQVKDAWDNVMGPAISKYTTGIVLRDTTLVVNLSSSVLREELSYGKEMIVKNLNAELGKELIQKIVLR